MHVNPLIPAVIAAGLAATLFWSDDGHAQPVAGPDQRDELLSTFVSELVDITPGQGQFPRSFQMGASTGSESERPVHRVEFTHKFAIAKYEVPQNLYQAVMGANPSRWKGPRNSVERMTWEDAGEFCRRLTKELHEAGLIDSDEEIRLPTEAEWEYCCRAGTVGSYSFGDRARTEADGDNQASILDDYGWHTGNAAGNDPPVGALKPNPWGLYDMHGYLWEYVADAWHDDYTGAPGDGQAWKGNGREGQSRVARGGSWRERYEKLRSASRFRIESGFQRDDVGLRCVKAARSAR